MVYQVIGKRRKTGEYQGNQYDNTILYVTSQLEQVEGYFCTTIKAKTIYVPETIVLGDNIEVFYDQYGNAVAINILKKGENKV